VKDLPRSTPHSAPDTPQWLEKVSFAVENDGGQGFERSDMSFEVPQ
jgi:hypothetical protein